MSFPRAKIGERLYTGTTDHTPNKNLYKLSAHPTICGELPNKADDPNIQTAHCNQT